MVSHHAILFCRQIIAHQATGAEPFCLIRDKIERRRLDLPVQVAIAGKVKVGKSTLLNALVGEELAPTDASECTRIVTWYRRVSCETLSTLIVDSSTLLPVCVWS